MNDPWVSGLRGFAGSDELAVRCGASFPLAVVFPLKYRGVEQLEARRAHNPEVGGSSPPSATRKSSRFRMKSGTFIRFISEKLRPIFED